MQFIDASPRPLGIFRLKVFERGRLILDICERNLWVTAGSSNSAQLYGGGGGGPITEIGFGTNATPPAITNTALTGAFVTAVGAITYPSAGAVNFAFALSTTQANGLAISEFGLLTAANTLIARKTRNTPIYKSSTVALAGSWTIQF